MSHLATPSSPLFVLSVQLLVQGTFIGETLIVAQKHTYHCIEESCHTTDYGEGLVECID